MSTEEFVLETRDQKVFAPSSHQVPIAVDSVLEAELKRIPNKLAFKIGEVADLVGVKAYVLRYWETEFEALKPKKSKHNQRMYERRDVEALLMIKKLLYRDRFSIEGARSALKKMKGETKRVKEVHNLEEHLSEITLRTEEMLEDIKRLKSIFC